MIDIHMTRSYDRWRMNRLPEPYRELGESLLEGMKKIYGDNLVSFAVFGSVARGTAKPDSDIDILIISRNLPDGRMNRILDFNRGEKEFEKPRTFRHIFISPVIKTPAEVEWGSPLFWDMTDCVAILFDQDSFFEQFLQTVKAKLDRNKARKVQKGDGWYWILKEDFTPGEIFEV